MAVEPIFESYGNKLIGVPNNEESGGSGGHVIENSSGIDLPQEDTLQFADSHVTDDSTNSKTVVETFKAVTEAEYSSETEDGAYIITDGDGAVIEPASEDYVEVTADGVKTYATLISELNALIDWAKVTPYSYVYLSSDNQVMRLGSPKEFASQSDRSGLINDYISFNRNELGFVQITTNNTINYKVTSSYVASIGTVLRLYYGNKKAVVDLQTTANRCLMPDGTTKVSDLLDSNVAIWHSNVTNVTASNAVTMVKPDGTEVISSYTGMIILQTSTSQAGSGSVYMVRSGYTTPVCEGVSARAPRLVIEDGVIKVKLNSDTTGRAVSYTVIKYSS